MSHVTVGTELCTFIENFIHTAIQNMLLKMPHEDNSGKIVLTKTAVTKIVLARIVLEKIALGYIPRDSRYRIVKLVENFIDTFSKTSHT